MVRYRSRSPLEVRAIPRITITLTDRTHRALEEAAARQGRSIGALIEECLELRGILPSDAAREIVARARSSAGLLADEAIAIVARETRLHREARDD